jgi:hypothetical protein
MVEYPIRRWFPVETIEGTKWNWFVRCSSHPNDVKWGHENTKKEAKKAANNWVCSVGGGTRGSSGEGDGDGDGDGNKWTYTGEDGKIYEITLEPPKINASMIDGHLEYFEMINPWTNEFHRFTLDDISGNELAWLTGLCFYDKRLSQKHELVAAQLKAWHVYLGGNSPDEIRALHNLTADIFERIASKSWEGITLCKITEENGTEYLDWTIEH